jgi:hypothetical protein
LAILLALVPVAACSGDGKDASGVQEEDAVGVGDKYVGICLDFGPDQGPDVTKLPVIDCELDHTHEIYFVDTLDENRVYPGFDVLEDEARLVCLTEFENYVGRQAFDSKFFYTWLVPSLESWNDKDLQDREILCLLGSRDNAKIKGKQRDANQ